MDEKKNIIIESWKGFMKLCSGRQQAYCKSKLDNAFVCHCVSIKDVFTADEIKLIKRVIKPKEKMCFKNSFDLCRIFPNRCKYIEGEAGIANNSWGVVHAWNIVDDKYYVDITFDLVLQEDVSNVLYVGIGTYDLNTITNVGLETGYYGGVYEALYRKNFIHSDIKL